MDVNRAKLLKDMRQVLGQTQALLEAGGEKLGKTRESVAEHLEAAKVSLLDLERDLERGHAPDDSAGRSLCRGQSLAGCGAGPGRRAGAGRGAGSCRRPAP